MAFSSRKNGSTEGIVLEDGIIPAAAVVGDAEPLTLAQSCAHCRHFRILKAGDKLGICRHDPPVVQIVPLGFDQLTRKVNHTTISAWPPVQSDQDCGKWEAKP